jgi:hypothetical protein
LAWLSLMILAAIMEILADLKKIKQHLDID